LALIAAVKRCGRFIITGKSVLYFKSGGKVKSDQLAGGFEFISIDLAENQSLCNYRGLK